MSTQNRISDYSIFGARPPREVVAAPMAPAQAPPAGAENRPAGNPRQLQFLVKREPRLAGIWRSLRVLLSPSRVGGTKGAAYVFRSTRVPQFRLAKKSFVASVAFHGSFILSLVYMHRMLPAYEPEMARREIPAREEIYFRVPLVDPKAALAKPDAEKPPAPPAPPTPADRPTLAPEQPQVELPKAGSTTSFGNLTIVSKPARPDNFHQTIIQPLSPPDVKIPVDVKVPNMVLLLAKTPDVPKPAFAMNPVEAKPVPTNRQAAAVEAPTLDATQPAPALPTDKAPDVAKPSFAMNPVATKAMQTNRQTAAVDAPKLTPTQPAPAWPGDNAPDIARPAFAMNPVAAKAVPTSRQTASVDAPTLTPAAPAPILPIGGAPDVAKPGFAMSPVNATAVQTNRQTATVEAPSVGSPQASAWVPAIPGRGSSQPQLAIPAAEPSVATQRRASNEAGSPAAPIGPALGGSAQSYGLVAIGINPADPGSAVVLPPGNRSGEFSISPAGSQPGTPGAKSNGAASLANANTSSTTSSANAAGSAHIGGSKGIEGSLSISGPGVDTSGRGMLEALGATMVYAVPIDVLGKIRKNQIVVSSGPMGGGGLNLYGAMQCGKIYTVFLQMPGKDWTLEYCEQKPATDATAPAASAVQPTVIHLENSLTPPEAQTRFDFQRLPVPPEKARKQIVLKGVLREDGTVDQVQIFQGLVPQMDEAARLALSQWKFKPALREGRPVTVSILVGISADPPAPAAAGH